MVVSGWRGGGWGESRIGGQGARKMAVKVFDLASYQHLLSEVHSQLRPPGENHLSPEQRELMAVLLVLIEKFEGERYSTVKAKPHVTLRELMRAHAISDLRSSDLAQLVPRHDRGQDDPTCCQRASCSSGRVLR